MKIFCTNIIAPILSYIISIALVTLTCYIDIKCMRLIDVCCMSCTAIGQFHCVL